MKEIIQEIIDEYGSDVPVFEEWMKIDVLNAEFLGSIDEYTMADFFDKVKRLDHIKTVLVSPEIVIDSMDIVDLLQKYIASGMSIEFIDNKKGGYLYFELECGVDDCNFHEIRRNSFPLADTFPKFLELLSGIEVYVANLDEDVYAIFKKISDDIYDRCGDGDDMFVNIKSIYTDPDELGDADYIMIKF